MKVDKTITLDEVEVKTALIRYLVFAGKVKKDYPEQTIPNEKISIQYLNGNVAAHQPENITKYKVTIQDCE